MELRLARARTTKDVDVRVEGDLDELIDRLARSDGMTPVEVDLLEP